MKSFIGKLILSFAMALQPFAFAEDQAPPAPAVKKLDPVVIGVKAFNMIQGARRMFLGMKAGANSSDEDYLDELAQKYKGDRLPIATAKDGMIWLQGLAHPLKVVDLRKGQFSYNGKVFDVMMKEGVEKSFDELNEIMFPKTAKFWNWILPEAEAKVDAGIIIAGAAAVGGLVVAANSCGEGPNSSAMGCGLGGFMGGFGLGYLLTTLLMGDKGAPPTGMSCYPGSQGCSQVVLMGPRGPVNTISQCPGQGYNYNPALAQVPPAQGQYMAQQLSALCPYPGTMGAINTAYASSVPPYVANQYAYRPVTAPAFVPYSTAKLKTNSMKTATVRPAIAAPLSRPPATPAGGAAK